MADAAIFRIVVEEGAGAGAGARTGGRGASPSSAAPATAAGLQSQPSPVGVGGLPVQQSPVSGATPARVGVPDWMVSQIQAGLAVAGSTMTGQAKPITGQTGSLLTESADDRRQDRFIAKLTGVLTQAFGADPFSRKARPATPTTLATAPRTVLGTATQAAEPAGGPLDRIQPVLVKLTEAIDRLNASLGGFGYHAQPIAPAEPATVKRGLIKPKRARRELQSWEQGTIAGAIGGSRTATDQEFGGALAKLGPALRSDMARLGGMLGVGSKTAVNAAGEGLGKAGAAGLAGAAAGGPATLVAAGAVMATKIGTEMATAFRQTITQSAGRLGAASMNNDAGILGAVVGVGAEATVKALEKIPVVGKVVSAVVDTMSFAVNFLDGRAKQAAANITHFGKVLSATVQGNIVGARATQLEKEVTDREKNWWFGIGKAINWFTNANQKLAAVQTIAGTAQALQTEAQRLAPYSGALSASLAQAEVAKLQYDIGKAGRMGDTLAAFNEAVTMRQIAESKAAEEYADKTAKALTQAVNEGRMGGEDYTRQMQLLSDQSELLKALRDGTIENKEFLKKSAEYLKELRDNLQKDPFTGDSILEKLGANMSLLPGVQPDPIDNWTIDNQIRPLG